MKAKSTFLAWNVLPSPTWATGSPNDDGPGLPMAAHSGNIRQERRIIRWMSVKRLAGQAGRLAKLARPPLDRARLGAAARRLTATLRELHQPTILALADAGFLGGERLALLGIAGRIAQAREGASEDELWLLRYAADCAGRSREGPTGGAPCKSRPINQRVRVIVRILYDQFYNLTGRRPTITVNPSLNSPASGAFLYLVRQVLAALAISASAEAAIRTELKDRRVHGRARRGSAKN